MNPAEYVTVIRGEGADLADAARGNLGARIPRYPAWTMTDLLVHVGSVHRRTTRIVRELRTDVTDRVYPPSEDGETVLPWFVAGLEEMADVLEPADPSVPVWGFGPAPTIGFWQRRMALETAVHRWDAESAVGRPRPLDPALAGEGIDEYIVMHVPNMRVPDAAADGALLVLQASDIGAAWTVTFSHPGVVMQRGGERGDAILTGAASDLYLELMGRTPAHAPIGSGDPRVLTAWRDTVGSLADATR